MGTAKRLTREEDGLLRRLHTLEKLGASLSPDYLSVRRELLSRDGRRTVRETFDKGVTTTSARRV